MQRAPGTIMFSVDASPGDEADFDAVRSSIASALATIPATIDVGLVIPGEPFGPICELLEPAVAPQPRSSAQGLFTTALTGIENTWMQLAPRSGVAASAQALRERNGLGPQSTIFVSSESDGDLSCEKVDEVHYIGDPRYWRRPMKVFPVIIPTSGTDQNRRSGKMSELADAVGSSKALGCVTDRSCFPDDCCHHELSELADALALAVSDPCYVVLPEHFEEVDFSLEVATATESLIPTGTEKSWTTDRREVLQLKGAACELASKPGAVVRATLDCP
jgi:hypothetical protein